MRYAAIVSFLVLMSTSARDDKSLEDTGVVIRVALAFTISSYCKGYRISRAYEADYKSLERLGSEHKMWKFFLSAVDDAEQKYNFQKSTKGCKLALEEWGPNSESALVVRK